MCRSYSDLEAKYEVAEQYLGTALKAYEEHSSAKRDRCAQLLTLCRRLRRATQTTASTNDVDDAVAPMLRLAELYQTDYADEFLVYAKTAKATADPLIRCIIDEVCRDACPFCSVYLVDNRSAKSEANDEQPDGTEWSGRMGLHGRRRSPKGKGDF